MSHLISNYTVCPQVFEFSIRFSLDLTFFEKLQTKILSSAFFLVKELNKRDVMTGLSAKGLANNQSP